jgi:hypothetical protein
MSLSFQAGAAAAALFLLLTLPQQQLKTALLIGTFSTFLSEIANSEY